MRFTLSSTPLSNKLLALSKVLNSRNTLPILSDFLFTISSNKLTLTASDGENTMETSIELNENDGDGLFAINGHDLLEAVKGISEQPITFDIKGDERIARISYLNGLFSLPIDNAEDYPHTLEINEGATEISIPSATLADCINRAIFATAQDEIRPVMNGIYFDLTPEHLAIVASDGHKLVRSKVFSVKADTPASFILPKKPAGLLKNALGKEDDVTIRFNSSNAEIVFAENKLSCRLIDGRYPNYNSVIPQNNPNVITIERTALLSALRRVMPFANDASNLIRFRLEYNALQLDAEDYDFAKNATERMQCDYNGTPMSIGFKGNAFVEVLSNVECQDVFIQLADPSRAGVVVPAEQPEGQDILMLLMPMLINE